MDRRIVLQQVIWARSLRSAVFHIPILLALLRSHDLSITDLFYLQGIFHLFRFLLELPAGIIGDRTSPFYAFGLGAFILAVGDLVLANAPTFEAFAVAEIALACGASLTSGADVASLAEISEQRVFQKSESRCRGLELFVSTLAILTGSIIAKIALQLSPYLTAVTAIIAGCLALRIQSTFGYRNLRNAESTPKVRWQDFPTQFNLIILLLGGMIVTSLFRLAFWAYQERLQAMNVPLAWFGPILAGLSTIAAGSSMLSTRILRGSEQLAKSLGLVIGTAAFCILGLYGPYTVVVIFTMVLMQFLSGLVPPWLHSEIVRRCDQGHRVLSLSFETFGFQLCATIMFFCAALAKEIWPTLLGVSVGMCGLALFIFWILNRSRILSGTRRVH